MATTLQPNQYKVAVSNRAILKMALPISLAILVPQINFITNNIFLGHLDQNGTVADCYLISIGLEGRFHLLKIGWQDKLVL